MQDICGLRRDLPAWATTGQRPTRHPGPATVT
jgi:hypothetical protein